MKNVTITLEEEVAQWARVWAARRNSSLSRLVGELLKKTMIEEEGYQAAMNQFMARPPTALKEEKERYPKRDELYDRDLLR